MKRIENKPMARIRSRAMTNTCITYRELQLPGKSGPWEMLSYRNSFWGNKAAQRFLSTRASFASLPPWLNAQWQWIVTRPLRGCEVSLRKRKLLIKGNLLRGLPVCYQTPDLQKVSCAGLWPIYLWGKQGEDTILQCIHRTITKQ